LCRKKSSGLFYSFQTPSIHQPEICHSADTIALFQSFYFFFIIDYAYFGVSVNFSPSGHLTNPRLCSGFIRLKFYLSAKIIPATMNRKKSHRELKTECLLSALPHIQYVKGGERK